MAPARIPAEGPDPTAPPLESPRLPPSGDTGPAGHLLRGRDDALSTLGDTLDRVRGGAAGAVVLVEGAAGIGKTRVLEEAARMAQRLHFAVGLHPAPRVALRSEIGRLRSEGIPRIAAHGVPHMVHVFPHGPHSLGLARDSGDAAEWTTLAARWIAEQSTAAASSQPITAV